MDIDVMDWRTTLLRLSPLPPRTPLRRSRRIGVVVVGDDDLESIGKV